MLCKNLQDHGQACTIMNWDNSLFKILILYINFLSSFDNQPKQFEQYIWMNIMFMFRYVK